jgi:hypothetical protein
MIAKPVVLVVVLNGHGRFSEEIVQTQQASLWKCSERITR